MIKLHFIQEKPPQCVSGFVKREPIEIESNLIIFQKDGLYWEIKGCDGSFGSHFIAYSEIKAIEVL